MKQSQPADLASFLKVGESLLKNGSKVRMKLGGTSMVPCLWPGDIALIEPIEQPVKKGQIVVAEYPIELWLIGSFL